MTTVRIFFEKCGEAAYISLLDLQRVFHRILKMSDLPVYYTQGYNPHIYLSFSCPLSLPLLILIAVYIRLEGVETSGTPSTEGTCV